MQMSLGSAASTEHSWPSLVPCLSLCSRMLLCCSGDESGQLLKAGMISRRMTVTSCRSTNTSNLKNHGDVISRHPRKSPGIKGR